MAGILAEIGGKSNINTCTFYVDSEDEVKNLPTINTRAKGSFANNPDFKMLPCIGSVCIVGRSDKDDEESDGLIIYILFTDGWKKI